MKRTKREKIRLGVLFVLIVVFFAVIAARLVEIQVFQAEKYGDIVDRQSTGKVAIPAERGFIYDRNGQLVAKNVFLSSLYAYPDNTAELNRVAAYLEKVFDLPRGTAKKKFGLRVRKFRYIKRRLDEDIARRIEADDVPSGLYIREESQREYPFGRVGKQILGFTDIDNKGQWVSNWRSIRCSPVRKAGRISAATVCATLTGSTSRRWSSRWPGVRWF